MAGECVEGSDRLAGWTGDWVATMFAGVEGGTSDDHGEEESWLYRWDAAASETGRVRIRQCTGSPQDLPRTSSVCNLADLSPVPRLGFVLPSAAAALHLTHVILL